MYWPDDLPNGNDCGKTASGRRSYHGKHELIASNHMEILSVCTFAGLASVNYWPEEDHEDCLDELYWRQTYDYRVRHLSVSSSERHLLFCGLSLSKGSGSREILHLQALL
jgi:hypothetical protein